MNVDKWVILRYQQRYVVLIRVERKKHPTHSVSRRQGLPLLAKQDPDLIRRASLAAASTKFPVDASDFTPCTMMCTCDTRYAKDTLPP